MIVPITIDIETIPDQRPGAYEKILDEVMADFRAPSSLTKEQAAIDLGMTDASEIKFTSKDAMLRKWEKELAGVKSSDVAEEKWRKTALSGSSGEIIVIGIKEGHEETETVHRIIGGSEKELLQRAFDCIGHIVNSNRFGTPFVGHNIEAFDLRFLWQRAVILGVEPPTKLILSRYSTEMFDTMTAWAGPGNRISLDALCTALGVVSPKKGDIDGSKVWDYFKDGRVEEIVDYCTADVDATYQCYRKMTFKG